MGEKQIWQRSVRTITVFTPSVGGQLHLVIMVFMQFIESSPYKLSCYTSLPVVHATSLLSSRGRRF